MAKTFNRRPNLIDTPTSSVLTNDFFVHHNWSGINENRNVLAVDQQSFSDANNIWVDSKGVLCSRPSMKSFKKNVVDVFIFGKIRIEAIDYGDFMPNAAEMILYNGYIDKTDTLSIGDYSGYTIIPWKSKLLMFPHNATIQTMSIYDIYTGKFDYKDDLIYIPTIEIIHNSVVEKFESPNVFTKSYKTRYLLDNATNVTQLDKLIGEFVDVTIGDDKYEVDFDKNTLGILTGKYCKIDDKVFNSELFGGTELPIVDVSDNGVIVICEYEYLNGNDSYRMYFTSDGLNVNYIPSLEGMINRPHITRDGHHVVAFRNDGPYIVTIIPTGIAEETFDQWTNLFKYNGYNASVNMNTIPKNHNYHQNTLIDGYFIDALNFVVSCASAGVEEEEYGYGNVWTIICENGYVSLSTPNTGTDKPLDYIVIGGGLRCVCKLVNGVLHTYTLYSMNSGVSVVRHTSDHDWVSTYYNYEFSDLFFTFYDTDLSVVYGNSGPGLMIHTINKDGELSQVTFYESDKINKQKLYNTDRYAYPVRSNDINVLDGYKYFNGESVNLLKQGVPVAILSDNTHYVISDGWIYSNAVLGRSVSYIDVINYGSSAEIFPEHFVNGDVLYISNGNTTYISSDADGKLYFPEVNVQKHDLPVVNLHQIAENKIAVFNSHGIDYITKIEGEYYYDKSRIPVGTLDDCEIITINDGKYTVFPSERGLAVMGYQDFVATADQSVSYVTDNIIDRWTEFSKSGPIKMCHHKFWIFIYNMTNDVFVFDIRNNSWWRWTFPKPVRKMYFDDELHLIVDQDFILTYDGEYLDSYDTETHKIPWHIESQKLHFDAPNHYKHIINFTFNSLSDRKSPLSIRLDVKNYRKQIDDGKPELFDYKIDVIRTFVKRVNYAKVCEFQYEIRYDDDTYINVPFEVSAITIKYKITGQVR